MKFELSQRFYFEAAHTLSRTIDAEPSARIHGHTYYATVTLTGTPDPSTGMLLEIDSLRETLDHRFLNELDGLGPVTLENLAAYIHQALIKAIPNIVSVTVERPASGDACTLRL
jgi:6-pyruvoyltetrahydropterin/6-carboxytetrahydropterin synthase